VQNQSAFRSILCVSVQSPFGGWVTTFAGFCFISGRFYLPSFWGFGPWFFGSLWGLPSLPTARCGSFTRLHRLLLPSPPSSGVLASSPRLFSFRLCFLCFRSVFVFALFLCSCFFVFSAALLIFSLLDLPPSVHCRAFPCDPSATSFNAPYTGRIRLLRDWLFSVLLVFSVCILLLCPCIAVFCL
jgi:hypothetical protein